MVRIGQVSSGGQGGQTRVIYCGETVRMKSRVRDTGGVKEQEEEEDRQ